MSALVELLINLITAVTSLLEAKMKLFKRSILRLGWAFVFVGIAAFLGLAATAFFLIGLYQYLSSLVSPPGASLLVSLAALTLALLFGFLARARARDD